MRYHVFRRVKGKIKGQNNRFKGSNSGTFPARFILIETPRMVSFSKLPQPRQIKNGGKRIHRFSTVKRAAHFTTPLFPLTAEPLFFLRRILRKFASCCVFAFSSWNFLQKIEKHASGPENSLKTKTAPKGGNIVL